MLKLFKFTVLWAILISGLPLQAQRLREAKPWIGIGIEKGPRGVLIKSILKNTPAEKAGLSAGDEIYEVEGKPVTEPEQLIKAVQSKGVGYQLALSFWHLDKQVKKNLSLEVQPDALEMLEKLYVDKPAPDFELRSLEDGKTVKLQDFKGKILLVEFWATWCPACRASQPYLTKLAKSHKNLNLIAVTSEEESAVKPFMKGQNFGYPVMLDQGDKMNAAYQVGSLPTFFLIDAAGVVKKVAIGGGRYVESLGPEIDKLGLR